MNAVGENKHETTGTKSVDHFVELLKYLATTQKGLTENELEQLANLGQAQLRLGLEVCDPFLLAVNGCYKLYNEHITDFVRKEWVSDSHVALCKSIGEVLELTPNSMRRLEELIYVLAESKSWFQLKQTVSAIENFLILFNPEHKFALGSCWGTLVGQHYDPVVEYNKSLELFEMHYQPSIEDLFRIVLQLSRFLKELVDFEAPDTLPEFKHPPIINRFLTGDHNPKFLKHKKHKASKLNGSQVEPTLQTDASVAHSQRTGMPSERQTMYKAQPEDTRLRPEEFSIESQDSEVFDHDAGVCVNYLADIGLLRELKRMIMYDQAGEHEILHEFEKINVDIPGGREKYIEHFRRLVEVSRKKRKLASADEPGEASRLAEEIMQTQISVLKPTSTADIRSRPTSIYGSLGKPGHKGTGSQHNNPSLNKIFSSQVSKDAGNNASLIVDKSLTSTSGSGPKGKRNPTSGEGQLDDATDAALQSTQLTQEPTAISSVDSTLSFYFYKRWLWIMFPWACMNIRDSSNFSAQIKKCFTSNIKYVKVQDELELTRQALGIAIKAKMKKKSVMNTLRGDFLMDDKLTHLESKILHMRSQRMGTGLRSSEPSAGYGSSFPINFDGADEIAIAHDIASDKLKQMQERTDLGSNPSGIGSRKNTAQHLKTLIANSQSAYTNLETTASRAPNEGSTTNRFRRTAPSNFSAKLQRDSIEGGSHATKNLKQLGKSQQQTSHRLFFPTAVEGDDAIMEQSKDGLDRADQTAGEQSFKRSFRSNRAGSASATKCLNALSFSNLELNMMNNACNTPLQQVVGTNVSAMKDSLGVQRMIRDVRTALIERTQRETQFLASKNQKMVSALNDMKHQNALQQQKLEALRRELKKDGLCIVRQNNSAAKVAGLRQRCQRTQEKLVSEMKQQERLKRIIEICSLNKDANEDCTRQLNYLVSNLDKLSKMLEHKIDQTNRDREALEELIKSTKATQKEKSLKTNELLDIVSSNFENQKALDKDFMETNMSWVGTQRLPTNASQFRSAHGREQKTNAQGPIMQKKKDELGAEKDRLRLLEEFREDVDRLSELFKVSPHEILATRGRLSTLPKFRGSLLNHVDHFSLANQTQHLENLQRTLADLKMERQSLQHRADFYRYVEHGDEAIRSKKHLESRESLLKTLDEQKVQLNAGSHALITRTQMMAGCKVVLT